MGLVTMGAIMGATAVSGLRTASICPPGQAREEQRGAGSKDPDDPERAFARDRDPDEARAALALKGKDNVVF
jgi:hypothetical protein